MRFYDNFISTRKTKTNADKQQSTNEESMKTMKIMEKPIEKHRT